jgi:hypothetical protein
MASGTSTIEPKIPKGSGSGPPECWGRADDVLRRCEQTAKAFGENGPGHEVTDDVRLFVASLVDDAIRTAISFDVSGEGVSCQGDRARPVGDRETQRPRHGPDGTAGRSILRRRAWSVLAGRQTVMVARRLTATIPRLLFSLSANRPAGFELTDWRQARRIGRRINSRAGDSHAHNYIRVRR